MHRWWLLATRNWWDSPGRTAASVLSIALGVGTVVIITCFYETARRAVTEEVVDRWLGNAHLTIHPPGAHWGSMPASLLDQLKTLDNVEHTTARLQRRTRVWRLSQDVNERPWLWVDASGIDARTEPLFRGLPRLEGRAIEPDERGVIILERDLAAGVGASLGDRVDVSPYQGDDRLQLTVIGLIDNERIAEFQSPIAYLALADLQRITGEMGQVSSIDVMLRDPAPQKLATAERALNDSLATATSLPVRVESAASRQTLLREADRITRFSLVLMSAVALLTSFFIILTTMSISLFERRSILGMMRCSGMTRSQLGTLILVELLPVGFCGTLLGLLVGCGLALAVPGWSGGAVSRVYLSGWGVGLAATSGVLTTLLSATVLVLQVSRMTPLAAVHPEARPASRVYPFLAGGIGVVMLAIHESFVRAADPTRWLDPGFAVGGVLTLYLGYILIAPAVVVVTGPWVGRFVAPFLGLPSKLAEDQFGRAPWRSTGVCWVLMVGLSLIVYIGIGLQAVLAVWDFPARLPETFVWSREYMSGDAVRRVAELPGIADVTTTTDMECRIGAPDAESRSATESLLRRFVTSLTRPVFVAADPDRILTAFKIAYVEGQEQEAREKIKRGGYVYIPVQTSRNKNLHVGDRITVSIGRRSAEFEVAAVVQCPALDIAVNMFQATSYMQIAAASAILGTRQDLKDKFGYDVAAMLLCNLDIPDTEPPPGFDLDSLPDDTDRVEMARAVVAWADRLPLERSSIEPHAKQLASWIRSDHPGSAPPDTTSLLDRFGKAIRYVRWSPERSNLARKDGWEAFRERLILLRVAETVERPGAIIGSIRRMKRMLDKHIRRATTVLTWLPSILLIVAAIGIGNLMMVSVQIRARQIAVLRAVGAVKSQIVRLVLAEAIALALVGSVIGLVFGFHEAFSDNRLTSGLIGFYPEYIVPWGTIALSVLFTVCVCLAAGLGPARRAARNNIIAAMQVT